MIPDIVTLAKGIGNGAPLAAVITTPKIAAVMTQKLGGNPVSSVVGEAVLEVIERENLQANALKLGGYIRAGLEKLKAKHPVIGEVRGKGLMLGIEFVKDRGTKRPGREECAQVMENARELGLLLGRGGFLGQTICPAPVHYAGRRRFSARSARRGNWGDLSRAVWTVRIGNGR